MFFLNKTTYYRSYTNPTMKCTICGTSINSVEDVLNEDWTFSFFDGEDEHGPLCPSCSAILLSMANDGEYELKREYKGKIIFNDQLEFIEDDPMSLLLGYILN